MEFSTIVGLEYIEGTGKKTGKPYAAYILHTICGSTNPSSKLIGQAADSTFVEKSLLEACLTGRAADNSLIGQKVLLIYGKSGYLQTLQFGK